MSVSAGCLHLLNGRGVEVFRARAVGHVLGDDRVLSTLNPYDRLTRPYATRYLPSSAAADTSSATLWIWLTDEAWNTHTGTLTLLPSGVGLSAWRGEFMVYGVDGPPLRVAAFVSDPTPAGLAGR